MRFLTGLIAGILLTVGTAFVVDAMHAPSGPDDKAGRQMVNWPLVSENIKGLSSDVEDGWARLIGQARQMDKRIGA